MGTRLLQIVTFLNVAPAAVVQQPHGINIKGTQYRPDFVAGDQADFTVVVTDTTVTVTNLGGLPATINVWLELKHTIPRELGGGIQNMTPQPFVILGTGASGGTVPTLYSPPEQWGQQDVGASQVNVPLSALVSTNFDTIRMLRAGSIIGLCARLTEAITAGQLTIQITINGVPAVLQLVMIAPNQAASITQGIGIDTYVAGDLIGMRISTDAGFLPITTDLESWLQLAEEIV